MYMDEFKLNRLTKDNIKEGLYIRRSVYGYILMEIVYTDKEYFMRYYHADPSVSTREDWDKLSEIDLDIVGLYGPIDIPTE